LDDSSAAPVLGPINQTDGLISYVTFKVDYNVIQNRFSISRTDPGRLFKTGQFDIAIEHYQLAKAFGCPWAQKFSTNKVILDTVVDANNPTYNVQPPHLLQRTRYTKRINGRGPSILCTQKRSFI
jgi:hypothetical protein